MVHLPPVTPAHVRRVQAADSDAAGGVARVCRVDNVARATRLGGARATRVGGPSSIGKCQLVSGYKGSYVPLQIKSPKEGDEKKKEEDLMESLSQEIWDKAKTFLPPKASDLRVLLSHPTVIITYIDAKGDLKRLDVERKTDPAFYDLVDKVKDLSYRIFSNLHFPGADTNRAAMGGNHLALCSQHWHDQQPHSLTEYLSDKKDKLGFAQLNDALPAANAGTEALNRIVAAEKFIQGMHARIAARFESKHKALEDPTLAPKVRKKLEQEKAELQALYSKLQNLDRHAIYSAVGVWGDTDAATATPESRLQKANELSNIMAEILKTNLKPGEDTRGRFQKFTDWMMSNPEGHLRTTMGPFVNEYAREEGDLLLHDKHEHLNRAEDDARVVKIASMEEFIVHNMMHLGQIVPVAGPVASGQPGLGNDSFNAGEAIDALGVGGDAAMRDALVADVMGARMQADTTRREMEGIPSGTLKERVKAAQDTPNLKDLVRR